MRELPVPAHFIPERAGEVWRVPYEERAREAPVWAGEHGIGRAADDSFRVCLLVVDVQNTFCIPDFELFVAGRSGTGAVDDSRRLCEFIYRNLGTITQILPSLDTHHAMHVFHAIPLPMRSSLPRTSSPAAGGSTRPSPRRWASAPTTRRATSCTTRDSSRRAASTT
jgi:hypothetical protein